MSEFLFLRARAKSHDWRTVEFDRIVSASRIISGSEFGAFSEGMDLKSIQCCVSFCGPALDIGDWSSTLLGSCVMTPGDPDQCHTRPGSLFRSPNFPRKHARDQQKAEQQAQRLRRDTLRKRRMSDLTMDEILGKKRGDAVQTACRLRSNACA